MESTSTSGNASRCASSWLRLFLCTLKLAKNQEISSLGCHSLDRNSQSSRTCHWLVKICYKQFLNRFRTTSLWIPLFLKDSFHFYALAIPHRLGCQSAMRCNDSFGIQGERYFESLFNSLRQNSSPVDTSLLLSSTISTFTDSGNTSTNLLHMSTSLTSKIQFKNFYNTLI